MKRSAAAKAAALPSIPGGGGTLLPKTMKGIGVEGSGYIDKENDADGAEGEVTVLPAIGNSVKPKRTLGGAASAAKNKLDALLKNVGDHGKGDDRRHHGVRSGSRDGVAEERREDAQEAEELRESVQSAKDGRREAVVNETKSGYPVNSLLLSSVGECII